MGRTALPAIQPAVGGDCSRRRPLVRRTASGPLAAADGGRRRCKRRGAVLQPRNAPGTLQHGRHAQGPAHGAPDHGLRLLLGHGPRSCAQSPPTAAAGMTRYADSPTPRCSMRAMDATSFQQQRNERHRERARGHAGRTREVRPRRTRPGRLRQLLQQGAGRTKRASCALVPGHCQAGDALDLRFEMDTIVLLHDGPHPLDLRPTLRAARRPAAGICQ